MQSLERAFGILDGMGARQLGVSEIAREQGLSKSSAHRLLTALRRAGCVTHDANSGRYALGLRLIELGRRAADRLDIRHVARPTMSALAQRSFGSCYLAVLDDGLLINVEQVDSPEPVRLVLDSKRLGRLPHTIGTGKVLMAALTREECEALIARLDMVALTPNTIVDRERLRAEMERVRRLGYGVNDQEQVIGVRGVAAPIRDRDGIVVAAVSVAASSARLTSELIPTFAEWVCAAADQVSRDLGAPPRAIVNGRTRSDAEAGVLVASH